VVGVALLGFINWLASLIPVSSDLRFLFVCLVFWVLILGCALATKRRDS
jgi:hypothetical protein